jgi:hypothetical protein
MEPNLEARVPQIIPVPTFKMCECKLDSPDLGHWKDKCFYCNSDFLVIKAICGCGSQCGHFLGLACGMCGSPQQPKVGEGWCRNIREIKKLMKDGCIKMGCKRARAPHRDYCKRSHAVEDGAVSV